MSSRTGTKWVGWLKPEDVEPEVLGRIRRYNERYRQYVAKLGMYRYWEAHQKTRSDIPLTDAEFNIKQRLLDS